MASVPSPPGGGPPTVVMTPAAAAQSAGAVRQALEQAGWRVIVASDPGAYAATAMACVVVFSPGGAAAPETSAAIGAGYTTLIPVITAPMPIPFAQWSVPPIPLGTDASQQQRAAATILQKLAQVTPGMPSAPVVAPPPVAAPPAPLAPQVAPYAQLPATPYAAAPAAPAYPAAPAPVAAPAYPPPAAPGYPQQPGYAQTYGQQAGYPTHAPKAGGFPGWLRNTIILGVIAAVLIGGWVWATHDHFFNPHALSGQWRMEQTITGASGGSNPATLSLTESGTQLTGSLNLSTDGSSGSAIPLTGTFLGQSVVLHGLLTDSSSGSPASLTVDLTGTAAGDDQTIQGNGRYALAGTGLADGTLTGPFTATHASTSLVSSGGSAAWPALARLAVARRDG